jgi:asparagine synthase (glutamine-hydrolysing)
MPIISGFTDHTVNYTLTRPKWEEILKKMQRSLPMYDETIDKVCLDAHTVMTAHASFKNCTVSFSGEIYNGMDLGKSPDIPSLIIELYRTHGIDFVNLLNGVFAIALYDHISHNIYLIRDRIGAKPLFYAVLSDTVIFGSQPKSLFAYPDLTPSLSETGLKEILGIGPARTPGCGVFDNVYDVAPGHIVTISHSGITEHTYWDLTTAPHTDDYDTTRDKITFLVNDAIARQCTPGEDICSFLSGGIDSSIVTSAASRRLKEYGMTLPTFSFDFKDNDIYFESNAFQPERDLPYVLQMSEYCGSDHTILECDAATLADLLPDAVAAKDFPGMADVDSSLLYFCGEVSKKNRVCLTGECADEVFGGYPWFYRDDLLNSPGFPWSYDTTSRTVFVNPDIVSSLDLSGYSREKYEKTLSRVTHTDGETDDEMRRREVSYLCTKWFMTTLLDRMDRSGSTAGIVARVPFADHRLVEYLYNVPWEMKYRGGTEKALLRDACSNLLPDSVLNRKKSPYPKTYNPAYTKLLSDEFSYILSDPNSPVLPLIDRRAAKAFLAHPAELSRPWFGQLMAGPQLIAYFIQINCWMKMYHLSV